MPVTPTKIEWFRGSTKIPAGLEKRALTVGPSFAPESPTAPATTTGENVPTSEATETVDWPDQVQNDWLPAIAMSKMLPKPEQAQSLPSARGLPRPCSPRTRADFRRATSPGSRSDRRCTGSCPESASALSRTKRAAVPLPLSVPTAVALPATVVTEWAARDTFRMVLPTTAVPLESKVRSATHRVSAPSQASALGPLNVAALPVSTSVTRACSRCRCPAGSCR